MKSKQNKELLNKDEIKFLKLLAKGIYIRHAGKQMGLSEYKSYKMSKNIKTKLNAINMPNAAYIALELGIL